MKFCKDCEHYEHLRCSAPENGINPVTGRVKSVNAHMSRTDIALMSESCGSEARFFVPKMSVPWWAFWRKWS